MKQSIPSWSAKYETGIKAIDRDHKALFEEIKNLTVVLLQHESAAHVEQAIDCLEAYVREHFEREENFMIQAGYPKTEAHIRTHRAMQGKVRCLREIHRSGEGEINPVKLATFLSEWLSEHILKTDMDYLPYLRGERDDRDPAIADNFHQVSLLVPESKLDVIERFLGVVMSDNPLAQDLSTLVAEFEMKLEAQEMSEARKIFCAD